MVELGLRAALGGLLLMAGALKLRAPAGFAGEIANYQLVPALAPALAATLPAIEIVVGVGLLTFPAAWRRAAAAVALVLFATFTLAVGSAYFRGINIACGCFGGGGGTITALTLVRNLALLAGAAALLAVTRSRRTGARP
jgi:putative oxidoreductase